MLGSASPGRRGAEKLPVPPHPSLLPTSGRSWLPASPRTGQQTETERLRHGCRGPLEQSMQRSSGASWAVEYPKLALEPTSVPCSLCAGACGTASTNPPCAECSFSQGGSSHHWAPLGPELWGMHRHHNRGTSGPGGQLLPKKWQLGHSHIKSMVVFHDCPAACRVCCHHCRRPAMFE